MKKDLINTPPAQWPAPPEDWFTVSPEDWPGPPEWPAVDYWQESPKKGKKKRKQRKQ